MLRRLIPVCLLAAMVSVGCSSAIRFTNPPTTPLPPAEREEIVTPAEPPREALSRVSAATMDPVIARYMTTPYQRGGSGPIGLDCSGFVYVVYRDYDGTRLPLTVQTLFRLDDRVPQNELSYGDLVFFRTAGRKVSHVGIYLGNDKFVHASETRGVAIDQLNSEFYAPLYAGARRVK
jgi:cell wall-associated NlpC family hydrolase